ncbi:tetratricopeptide repeat protein [Gemmobacter sp.]|uniref:tetratricopeptide repeat protein n=1 Tax=Gemmobacter sp. TaxID=1898957 RepID=UPI002AFF558D|nr:tetratricopeptide repeat protein [Gemmobacter sp.]
MMRDLQGNPLAGASATAAMAFDDGLRAYATYHGDPIAALDRGIADSPECAMLWLAKGWLYALATEPGATAMARDFVARAAALPGGAREAAHGAALARLLEGNWSEAAILLERWQAEAPHDLLALQSGHLIDFFTANARSLRDRVARVLPQWREVPGESWVMGMAAFGFEEAGDYAQAEDLGREAVDRDPRDSWAHHAVAHVMEMMGRPQDGLGWMAAREPWWASDDDNLQVHNWWHRALCHVETDDIAGALRLYDGPVRRGGLGLALCLADGAALLWRLEMQGADVGNRWDELSDKWEVHEAPGYYAFNDMHAAMAHLGAGRFDRATRLLAGAEGDSEAAQWMRRYGLPLIDGMIAFRRGDHATAADRLMQARHISGGFGGSHAQRDVIDWTLTEAAIRGRMPGLAEALARERLTTRPHSPVNRGFLRRAVALREG